jgi:hypothetical protein
MHGCRLALVTLGFLVASVILAAAAASAQPEAPLGSPASYGTAAEIAHVVGAFEFTELSGDARTEGYGQRWCVGGPCSVQASVRLPSGALVSRIELDACDDNATGKITFSMGRTPAPNPGTGPAFVDLTPFVDTGATDTPGCAFFTNPLSAPVTIDNRNFNYLVSVSLSTNADTLSFSAVRVYYTLQVSPAPGAATFGDVPTSHPFFRYVEALVASGITAGCGSGNYCPDAPLTRGQMAVFLGKALGLHFVP